MKDFQQAEVDWARRNGFNHRIRIDNKGRDFVIGDWAWNRDENHSPETIEPLMQRAGVYKEESTSQIQACEVKK